MSEGCTMHPDADQQKLDAAMGNVKKKILVLSGKGGVGKSTVAANLAISLAEAGHKVGLLDVDIHGPSIPRLTGLAGQRATVTTAGIDPIQVNDTLSVMSIAFLLQNDSDAVIWRGPMKYSVIKQLLADTNWGELDYLVVDAPPGTGDEPLSVAQLVGENASAVLVTTPQIMAVQDVRRCVTFCQQLSLPVAGIVENMAGLICPNCQTPVPIFGQGGGAALATETNLKLLGSIPLDPAMGAAADQGKSLVNSGSCEQTHQAFCEVLDALEV